MLNSNYIDINNKKAQTPSVLLSTAYKVYISTWWRVSGHFSLPYLLHSFRNRIACTFVRVVPWHLHKRQKRSLALFDTFSTLIFVFSSSTISMRIARVQKNLNLVIISMRKYLKCCCLFYFKLSKWKIILIHWIIEYQKNYFVLWRFLLGYCSVFCLFCESTDHDDKSLWLTPG